MSLENLKKLFSRKKDPDAELRLSKERIAKARQTSENLKAKLLAINIENKSGKIEEHNMALYGEIRNMMAAALDTQEYVLDTTAIDTQMMSLPQKLQEAVYAGKNNTANYIIRALQYGIETGHKPVGEDQWNNIDVIMDTRLEILQQYVQVVGLAKRIDQLEDNINNNSQQLKITATEFDLARKKLDEETSAQRQDIMGGHVTTDMVDLAQKKQLVKDLYGQVIALNNDIAQQKLHKNELETVEKNMLQVLSNMNDELNEYNEEKIQMLIDDYIAYQTKMQTEMVEMDKINRKFANARVSFLQSDKMVKLLWGVEDDYAAMLQDIQRREQEEEEGRKLAEERERQIEQETQQETQRILNN